MLPTKPPKRQDCGARTEAPTCDRGTEIVRAIRRDYEDSERTRFFLYLQPPYHLRRPWRFWKYKGLPASAPACPIFSAGSTRGLERDLAREIGPSKRLITLSPDSVFLNSEDAAPYWLRSELPHWQNSLIFLSANAEGIVCIPSNTSRVLWLISRLLSDGLNSTTVFIMPPAILSKEIEGNWKETSEKLRSSDIYLPEYRRDGMVFVLGDKGDVSDYAPMTPETWRFMPQTTVSMLIRSNGIAP